MRKTKIVCTLGPASSDEKTIRKMLLAGMNIARLNFSHGTHEGHKEYIEMFRRVRDKLGVPAAVMLDTKGPEIRLGKFEGGKSVLKTGDHFVLCHDETLGNNERVCLTYNELDKEIRAGNRILIDDGMIELTVTDIIDRDIHCTVTHGGPVSDRKGVNLPGVEIGMDYMSEDDKADILFGIEMDVDFIAASFVRTKEDVVTLRKFLDYHGGHDIKIISKIENMQGVKNFDEILGVSDGIMVARGDMGVEVPFEQLPGLQKRFIRRCYTAGKMVITATQMLESMINNPSPTRAEISDVANAVFDGTSAIMLSGESAMGKYPVKAVETMATVAEQAEKDAFEMDIYNDRSFDMDSRDMANAICDAACTTAKDIDAKAIIAVTMHGHTARRMSKFRPRKPIVAATPVPKAFHQLALSWGVYPVMARMIRNSDEFFIHAADCAKQIDLVRNGDKVVITAGLPLQSGASTNCVRIYTVGDIHMGDE